MQERCYFCTRKHLGYAEAFMQEAINGYPLHKWLAVGQLCAAEGEIMCEHPEMAYIIREERVKYIDDMNYEVPILDLIEKVTLLAAQFEEHSDDVKYASEYGFNQKDDEIEDNN